MTSSSQESIRIVLVDDHPVVRTGLKYLLESQPGFAVVAEAAGGAETLALVDAFSWDVMLLDLALPDMSGLDALKSIKQRYPINPILVVSGYSEARCGGAALGAGADGYLNKACAPVDLFRAVRNVVQNRHLETTTVGALAPAVARRAGTLHSALSPREFEVFLALAAGASIKQIAARLQRSDKTISTFRTRLLQKMSLSSNADLTYYAIKNDLIP